MLGRAMFVTTIASLTLPFSCPAAWETSETRGVFEALTGRDRHPTPVNRTAQEKT